MCVRVSFVYLEMYVWHGYTIFQVISQLCFPLPAERWPYLGGLYGYRICSITMIAEFATRRITSSYHPMK